MDTKIILHLREDALDYLQSHKVKQIINKYSDHISLPIEMQKEVWQQEEAVEGEEPKPGQYVKTDEWEAINSASALWTRNKNEVTEEQYVEFYKNLSHDFEATLACETSEKPMTADMISTAILWATSALATYTNNNNYGSDTETNYDCYYVPLNRKWTCCHYSPTALIFDAYILRI